ncbi:polysaccharide deacetylase family protein [Streptomyces beijiangensis]|uniref:polysaccharide deacetylase family protein n=1 Tax=Streptomyces beijiangensis TaxID=163361 RepID=UPI003556B060
MSDARQHRPRVVIPLLVLLTLMCVLLLGGYVRGDYAADHRTHPLVEDGKVPRRILDGGPIVDATGAQPRSLHTPEHTIVLTFDDGPDPRWTPRILAVLKKHGVPATFFVTGTMTSRHPGIVADMVREGHEIGLHTFGHPDLAYKSAAGVDREMAQAQLALAGAAGIHSSLFRPPYSSTTEALDNASWPVVQQLGAEGYISAFIDQDTDDWRRPGVQAIVDGAIPQQDGQGAIVLLHDSGGDRSQTVAALDLLIPQLKARGYHFTTIAEAAGAVSVNQPVHGTELWRGRAFVGAVVVSEWALPALAFLLTVVGFLVLGRFTVLLALARRHARVRRKTGFSWGPAVTEPVSVIVPAYNESACIADTLRSLAASDHPVEIIVVDDGSTDDTAEIARSLELPGVTVLCQRNLGKSSALNTGIAHAGHELIVMVDGDTIFEPSTVGALVQPFADPAIGAVAGNARVGNHRTMISRWQHIEYVMGFNLDRRMYDVLRCMPTVPGAVGAYRRAALDRVGRMSSDTLAEDTDITMALHRDGWQVVYEERARAHTEAPGSLGELWRQRYRWSYGTMQAMWKHRGAMLDRGHSGRFGRVGLPLVAVFTVLTPLLAPLIDLFALYGFLFMDPARTAVAWCAVLGVQAACAAYAFRLDGEPLRRLWPLPLQQVVYRQLMYMVLIQSCLTAISGGRLHWHKLRRTGEVGEQLMAEARIALPATVGAVPLVGGPGPSSRPGLPGSSPVPSPVVVPVTVKPAVRDRYLDLLRALALVRVVVYHTFGWAWLTIAFPSLGVMFALAGSLMARSLSRPALSVIRSRMRRLLIPFWVFAVFAVTWMLWRGWSPAQLPRLALWILPLGDPPGSEWGAQLTGPLWYIRAYLWFVLLSPVLLWAWRRAPLPLLGGFLALTAVFQYELIDVPELPAAALTDLGIFGACWVLGFAHRDGSLDALRVRTVLVSGAVLMAAGGWFTFTHPTDEGYDLGEIPLGQALWSLGFVLLLMRFRPRSLPRMPGIDGLVRLFNNRAVTIYLWHEVALVVAVLVTDLMWQVGFFEQYLPLGSEWFVFLLVWPLIGAAILLVGWAEDLASRKRPDPWPTRAPRAGPPRPAGTAGR